MKYLSTRLDGPQATEYADLRSIEGDLTFAREAFDRSANIDVHQADGALVVRALHSAALVAYRRCFTTGRRRTLREFADRLPAGLKVEHEQLLEEASRHVAHRVNEYEQTVVSVALVPPPERPRALGINDQVMTRIASEDLGRALEVIDHLRPLVRTRIDALRDELLASVRADLAHFYRLAGAPIGAAGPDSC